MKIVNKSILDKILFHWKEIAINNGHVDIFYSNKYSVSIDIDKIDSISSSTFFCFFHRLEIQCGKNIYSIKYIPRENVDIFIQNACDGIFRHKLNMLHKLVEEYAEKEFLRDSSVDFIKHNFEFIKNSYEFINKITEKYINVAKNIFKFSDVDKYIEYLRTNFEEIEEKEATNFFNTVESNPLTKKQRLSVIRDNDLNLVLAAAGTGKTSVIVSKVLNYIIRKNIPPEHILVLAYNKSAARELTERILLRGQKYGIKETDIPTIKTFHALGLDILRKSHKNTHISVFADDEKKLLQWISKWIEKRMSRGISSFWETLLFSYFAADPFDFESTVKYEAYLRDTEYRTLNDEKVRGFQEVLIANWLFIHNVPYKYEEQYISKRRIDLGFDYRPDFHIVNTNIYIEHFGIDRNGNTRPGIDPIEYNKNIERKRALHKEFGTILLETFHYDWTEGNLENRLQTLLSEVGIPLEQKSPEELNRALQKSDLIIKLSTQLLSCLHAIRVESLDSDAILQRLKKAKVQFPGQYTTFLTDLHNDYKEELADQCSIDFDDMILMSTQAIRDKEYVPEFKYILIDEFQDISSSRWMLVKEIIDNSQRVCTTCVGDDWQSIYRFSGGKLELTTQFDKLIGKNTCTILDKTFRYNNSIAETAGTFIMENPQQYKKYIETNEIVSDPQVFLLDDLYNGKSMLSRKVYAVIRKILASDPAGKISILARYNYILDNIRDDLSQYIKTLNVKINFWTFHKSKGLESDYCILCGFFQGRVGFPNENKDHAIVEALLPSLDDYPFSEERRLFYVALTRARKKSYIIADPRNTSIFIDELLSEKYNIHIVSDAFLEKNRKIFKCPSCKTGYISLQQGKYGDFYQCSSGLACRASIRTCPKCGSPSIDSGSESICNNPSCGFSMKLCPICGRKMVMREGKYGKFWGCSGYGLENDRCFYTEKIS